MNATQAPHPLALTAAGKRLADALVEADVLTLHEGEYESQLMVDSADINAAAETLMPAEGAGLREALGRQTADVGVFGPIDGMGNLDLSGSYVGLSITSKSSAYGFRISMGAAEVLSAELAGLLGDLSPALASPQPAVEGPIAAGGEGPSRDVLVALFDKAQRESKEAENLYDRIMAQAAAWVFRATLTPPADPKPTAPGNDAGMREAVARVIDPSAWRWRDYLVDCGARQKGASEYGQCYAVAYSAGCRTGDDFDKYCRGGWPGYEYIAVSAARINTSLRTADNIISGPLAHLAPQTGSAGEDPKTPDAGVDALAWEREANRLRGVVTKIRDFAKSSILVQNDALDVVRCVASRALAQPAPVGEDETGVREPITDHGEAGASIALRVVQRVCDFDDRTSPEDQPEMMLVTGQELTDLIEEEVSRYWPESALANQPPKPETPAGDLTEAERAENRWAHGKANAVARLYGSTAPAARPGDEVERAETQEGTR